MTRAHTNVWANGQLIATYDPNGLHFFLSDWTGSRHVQTDYEGTVEQTCTNLPYGDGQTCGATPTENLYAGLEWDNNANVYKAMYRQYAPAFGRWSTPDPYDGSYDWANPQSLNRYAYAGWSPFGAVDPSGLDASGWFYGGVVSNSDLYGSTVGSWLNSLVSLKYAMYFGSAVFLTTVSVRIAWVLLYRASVERATASTDTPLPPARVSFLTSWCGIRGILTIATASALPPGFPGRSLIVFTAFSVVLGTLVVQGFTIGPLIKLLHIEQDDSLKHETEQVREQLLRAGLNSLGNRTDAAAAGIRKELDSALKQVGRLDFSVQSSGIDKLRRGVVEAQRKQLIEMRDKGEIEEDVFQALQEELDWASLAASPSDDLTLEEV